MHLKFGRKICIRDKSLGVGSIQMVFKNMRLVAEEEGEERGEK